jgi:hypothetical protein
MRLRCPGTMAVRAFSAAPAAIAETPRSLGTPRVSAGSTTIDRAQLTRRDDAFLTANGYSLPPDRRSLIAASNLSNDRANF